MSANRLRLNTNKTELVWIGSRYSLASLEGCGPSLQLGADVIKPSTQVRLLGVTVAADLSLDGHASSVCKTCFFWLRQLRRVRRSLDADSLKTLVHAFVTSRVDYCNSVLASAPKTVTEKLQRVQNAAARLITGTHICRSYPYTTITCKFQPRNMMHLGRGCLLAWHARASRQQAST